MQPAPRVVKDPYSSVVYLLIDNKKCAFPDQKCILRNLSSKKCITMVDCVSAYQTGPSLDTNMQLIKGKDSPKVYLAQFGQKRWIADQKTFFSLGFNWDKVLEIEHAMLQLYKDGPNIQ